MVSFKPFRGYLPRTDIGQRVSPPYDVIGGEELRELLSRPYNVTRITLNPQDGRYLEAASELEGWIQEGELVRDDRPAFYLYRQSFDKNGERLTRTGIVGALGLEPYERGNVIPHEETIPHVKEDRLRLLQATRTHAESIFGLFHHSQVTPEEMVERAEELFQYRDGDGVDHQFYRLADEGMVARIERMMEDKRILIADGHHRYETALRHFQDGGSPWVMTTLVSSDDEGMMLLPTHRLVRTGLDQGELVHRLQGVLDLLPCQTFSDLRSGVKGGRLGFMTSGGRYLADIPRRDDVLWSIDAHACRELVFENALADRDLDTEYGESASEVRRRVKAGEFDLGILLAPPTLEEVWTVASHGLRMPKKSTFFYPKIWSGFVYLRS
ncbi:MAG: DUF1015 family protein [Methanomassiliicoccales archaeon]